MRQLYCPICKAPLAKGETVCRTCAEQLDGECFDSFMSRCPVCYYPRTSDDYECERCNGNDQVFKVYCVARYDGNLSYSVIDSLKFHGHREMASVVALYLRRALEVLDPKGEALLVPVPCSKARRRKYGWDQMLEVCKALKRPYISLLTNNVDVSEQKGLGRTERIRAALGKFMVNPRYSSKLDGFRDRKIIVVDDIATTMATMASAIALLKTQGFSDVCGATWLCEL